jgi:hypothetical protein
VSHSRLSMCQCTPRSCTLRANHSRVEEPVFLKHNLSRGQQ